MYNKTNYLKGLGVEEKDQHMKLKTVLLNSNKDINNVKEFLDQNYETYSYSGRGMYGKKCLAVTISRDASLAGFVAKTMLSFISEYGDASTGAEMLVNMFEQSKTDSMGLDTVLYFPSIKWNPDWDSEEDL